MPDGFLELGFPDRVFAKTSDGEFDLTQAANGGGYSGHGVELRIHEPADGETAVDIEGSEHPIYHVIVEWSKACDTLKVLGDAWERAYGDLAWDSSPYSGPVARSLTSPWYFLGYPGFLRGHSWGRLVGVKTGGASMVSWNIDAPKIQAKFDLRSGNRPLRLLGRQLRAGIICSVQARGRQLAGYQSCLSKLCDHPRLAHAPIYGINDWYYAYGNNTADRILDDSKRAADWAAGLHNRPFSVIDDGWEAAGGTWTHGNERFPDMPGLANAISKAGCRPGLWVRPLKTDEKLPDSYFMAHGTLDPSRPEALEKVHELIYRIHHWGYEMIKHDYSTFDVCGLWGKDMTDGVAGKRRTFGDDTRTTAEILRGLYQTIRDAAGSSLVLGCNTVGHLAAGLEEAQRIGDDTSGREWSRTVKMGVNSLAYRGIQQGVFYEVDPDCVPITTDVSWKRTQQWLDLVSGSGTALFVSAQKEALGPGQERALKAAFKQASVRQPLATPASDMQGLTPTDWRIGGKTRKFDWS